MEDYILLDESEAFEGDTKTELIAEQLLYVNGQHRPHASTKIKLYNALRYALGTMDSNFSPLVAVSIFIPLDAVPEPDILITSEPDGEGLVPLGSVALDLQVSDTTLDNDLGRKATLSAAADIPLNCVADICSGVIHKMWAAHDVSYGQRRSVAFDEALKAATTSGLTISTATL